MISKKNRIKALKDTFLPPKRPF